MAERALPLSVWPAAQRSSRAQRSGRYLPVSGAHPAKMLPAIARAAIEAYTEPGDIVCDPMCGDRHHPGRGRSPGARRGGRRVRAAVG